MPFKNKIKIRKVTNIRENNLDETAKIKEEPFHTYRELENYKREKY